MRALWGATLILAFMLQAPMIRAFGNELGLSTGIEFPQPLTLGVQYKTEALPAWVAFYKAGFFAYPFSGGSRSVSIYSMEIGARYHPFLNGFYVAGQLGFRKSGVTVDISNLKQDGVSLANTATASLGTVYTGLLLGHEWRLTPKFSIAIDAGMQFALIHSGGITISADPSLEDGTDNSVSDQKEMRRISGLPVPQIAVLRLVWYI
jgi:hypothetical protein